MEEIREKAKRGEISRKYLSIAFRGKQISGQKEKKLNNGYDAAVRVPGVMKSLK